MRSTQEFRLQVAVVEHLRSAFPEVLFTHPSQKAKDKREGMFNKMLGVRAGTPDLLLWYNTEWTGCLEAGGIELKSPEGRRTPKQGTFELLFKRVGGKHAYCRSVQEVHDTLVSWGVTPVHSAVKEPDTMTQQQKFSQAYEAYKP